MSDKTKHPPLFPPAFMDKPTAAHYTSLSWRTLDYARERGELSFIRVGKRVLFARHDLDVFVESYRVDPVEVYDD